MKFYDPPLKFPLDPSPPPPRFLAGIMYDPVLASPAPILTMFWWEKCHILVWVVLMSFSVIGGTYVMVTQMSGGTDVVHEVK
jgi:hypothetical protein